jgi:MerR family copper efflux transcriptional regulator
MCIYQQWSHKLYIGEISKLSGATPKAIRLYESLGLLSNIKRNGNYRIYDESDVEFVRLIKVAQTLGMSLSDLKNIFVGHNELNWQSALELLHEKNNNADDKIASLILQKKRIEEYRINIQECLDSH